MKGARGGQREPPVVKQVMVVVSQGQMVVIVSGVEMRLDKADLGRQRDGGPGSTGDGTNEGPRSAAKSRKTLFGITWPSSTKSPSYNTGQPPKMGWHRVGEGKTAVMASALVASPVTVSEHHGT